MRPHKFHGRYETDARECEAPDCAEPGEFRAPGSRAPSFDGPGDWRWFCLEHVRAFNSGYEAYARLYRVCTVSAEQAMSRLLVEAEKTARDIHSRYAE